VLHVDDRKLPQIAIPNSVLIFEQMLQAREHPLPVSTPRSANNGLLEPNFENRFSKLFEIVFFGVLISKINYFRVL
jgi:hypothetical protein